MPSNQIATTIIVHVAARKRAKVLPANGTQMRPPMQLKKLFEKKKAIKEETTARRVPRITVTLASPVQVCVVLHIVCLC
ncbi:hypothetical protein SVAN01_09741 [Stagonosporopsis vannaccii]|nr:hypothetical protein SVAN01_09741 [Stagonosporopsis vannaccii]